MSIRVLSDVWNHSKAEGGDLLVLLAIADFADDTGLAWPSIETIAMKSRMGDRNVRRILRRLEKDGDLAVERTLDGRKTNRYRVTLGGERQRSFALDLSTEDNSSGRADAGATRSGRREPPTGGPETPQSVIEPSLNRQKKEKLPVFEAAWNECPHARDPNFIAKWAEWEHYRKSKRKPISPLAGAKQLKILGRAELADAIEAIEKSIANDYQGVFPKPARPGYSAGRQASFA